MIKQMPEETVETKERKTADIAVDIKKNLCSLVKLFCELLGRGGAVCRCIAMSFFVNFIVEALCRQSLYECVVYINNHTFSFLFNTIIIMFTYCFGVVLKKRYFYYMIVSVFWLGLGVTSAIILSFRQTPLTANDFMIARSAIGLFDKYLSDWQMGLLFAVVGAVIVAMFVVLFKAPKATDISFKRGLSFVCGVALLLAGSMVYANRVVYSDSDCFASLIRAFDNYGFAYSFSVTTFDGGIDKPVDYTEDYIAEIKNELLAGSVADNPKTPNIIYLQLESFFDVNHIVDYFYSEDPVPNFRRLKAEYPSGYLTVPSIGGGTSNTEFEVLTGMNMDYFGAGEYPFKTVMKERTTESVCHALKSAGYTAHAIHNYTGTFYDRNLVYTHLGFDTFTPMEYMYHIKYNKGGWARDIGLIEDIMKALAFTEGHDFIHTVSVQGHGQYPNKKIDPNHTITMEGIESDSARFGFEYYLNEIHEMDLFIAELTNQLSAYGEDVVLVMYGDHLPTFAIGEEQLENKSIYQTEYVIWSNFGLQAEDRDMYAYELTSHVMKLLGRNEGWMTKFHHTVKSDDPEFEKKFRAVEYDLLYGTSFLNDGVRYEPTVMRLGIDTVSIDNVYMMGEELHVTGQNFNRFSTIVVDGEIYDTKTLDGLTLSAIDVDIEPGSEVYVVQKRGTALGGSNRIIYEEVDPSTFVNNDTGSVPLEN